MRWLERKLEDILRRGMARGRDWWDIARRDCIGNFFMRKEFIGREDRYSQDWKLSLL